VSTDSAHAETSVPVSRRARLAAFGAVSVLFSLPVLLVRWPPILDVAQQMEQIRLFVRALRPLQDTYEIQWLTPNKLSYLLLALADRIGGAHWGPRLAIVFCLVALLASIHLLGATFHRPLAGVVLASVFALSSPYYGGFLNFVVGGLAFWWWLRELASERGESDPAAKLFSRALLGGFALYLCHALWLAAGLGLTLLSPWMHRRPGAGAARRRFVTVAWRIAGLAPWVAGTVAWLLATEDPERPFTRSYVVAPWLRLLLPSNWSHQLLGGVVGPTEPLVLIVIGLWMAIALAGARREPLLGCHRALLVAAAAFLIAGVLLPDIAGQTQLFARRWWPWLGVCLLLAAPEPRISRRLRAVFPWVVVAGLSVATINIWRTYEREELHGFAQALAAVPDHSRLLSLDYFLYSPRFWGPPFFQLAAYAQLDRDVELNFSFAELRSSLVVYREHLRKRPWTRALEVQPDHLKERDLRFFDYALIHLPAALQPNVPRKFPALEKVAGEGDWALYRIVFDRVRGY
jgi:hypothetical protein